MPSPDLFAPALCWNEYGDPGGRPVLFFHGWPSSRLQGEAFHAQAARRGWRIIAPDRPGIGKSPAQPGRRLGDWPRTLAALMDRLGIECCPLIGMSGGGPYALAGAAGLPQRVTAAAVICGAPPLHDAADRPHLLPVLRRVAKVSEFCPAVVRAGFQLVGWGTRLLDVASARRLAQLSTHGVDQDFFYRPESRTTIAAGLEAWRQGGLGLHEEGNLYLEPWDFAPEEIRMPVAIWHGTEDTLFHWSLAEKLSRRVPGARFFPMEGRGHFELIYAAQEAAFDWLEEVETARASASS